MTPGGCSWHAMSSFTYGYTAVNRQIAACFFARVPKSALAEDMATPDENRTSAAWVKQPFRTGMAADVCIAVVPDLNFGADPSAKLAIRPSISVPLQQPLCGMPLDGGRTPASAVTTSSSSSPSIHYHRLKLSIHTWLYLEQFVAALDGNKCLAINTLVTNATS